MSTRLQKHGVLGIFHICTLMERVQCASQCAWKASHVSASKGKELKNRNYLVESEDLEHIARSGTHVASVCFWGYLRAYLKISKAMKRFFFFFLSFPFICLEMFFTKEAKKCSVHRIHLERPPPGIPSGTVKSLTV